ncbi:MAG: type II toxin-antitoxin system RelE/ParE family toxin [Lachnospiraceae bacterium]|nr:type II toxin-antitoxin system RelE/ParE family toxin [Lachnospiraceae bacterium]
MKTYKVVITAIAKAQIKKYLKYLSNNLKNPQAARAVRDDYKETIKQLKNIAGSLKDCDNPNLANRNLRRICFQKHDYVMLYRIDDNTATVVRIYHMLQDYENKMV